MKNQFTNKINISVIVPLYNKEKSIFSTITSILNQTCPDFELIVVNDGSTDKSTEVVKQFNDTRIRLIDKDNGGVSSARNFGVDKSKYDYITFLDADDLWLPNALEEFSLLITQFPDAELYASGFSIDENVLHYSDKRFLADNYYYYSLLSYISKGSPLMITGCVAMQKNCFYEVGGYNSNFSRGEDLDLWKRLTERFKLAKSEVVTLIYRQNTDNRVSYREEPDKTKLYHKYPKSKNEVTDKYQKILYGLIAIGDLRYYIKHLKGFGEIVKLLCYFDWIVWAVLFYTNNKLLKIHHKEK